MTYDISGLDEDFIIHYGSESQSIDAFTFANSLTAIGNALQAINREINPGNTLEISVIALGGCSFRRKLTTKAKRIGTVLFGDVRRGVISALAVIIVVRLFRDEKPALVINIDNVEIHSDSGDVIILLKEIYEAYNLAKHSPEAGKSIQQAFEVIEEDEAVKSFGFAQNLDEKENLPFNIDRTLFADVARPHGRIERGQPEKVEPSEEIQIIRAILEDSARRWQFVWRGIRISAPVLDIEFRKRMVRGLESFRHGDTLIVDLRILQSADESGVWINERYEVVNVIDRRSATKGQGDLLDC